MQLIREINGLNSSHRPCVATIGNFDGVHLGHETVIQTLLTASKERGLPAAVITFEPLAKEYFSPTSSLRLQPLQQRVERLFELGVDLILVLEFNKSFAAYSPAEFVEKILVAGLGVTYLSVGDDFKFGHMRAGDFDFLKAAGKQHGFSVVCHDTFALGGERVSSGRVRDAVHRGDFAVAQALLGRPYAIQGVVRRGEQRGRALGFPTANIVLDKQNFAIKGVYSVKVKMANGEIIGGVANVGRRPTVAGQENRLEVHLFDFHQDLYGSTLSVEFVAKIRAEKKFASLDDLRVQIGADAIEARQHLKRAK